VVGSTSITLTSDNVLEQPVVVFVTVANVIVEVVGRTVEVVVIEKVPEPVPEVDSVVPVEELGDFTVYDNDQF
jgi:hypothetical protein